MTTLKQIRNKHLYQVDVKPVCVPIPAERRDLMCYVITWYRDFIVDIARITNIFAMHHIMSTRLAFVS